MADVQRHLGAIDVLVANHGIGESAPYDEVDAEMFEPVTWGLAEMGKQLTSADYLLGLRQIQQTSRTIAKFFDMAIAPSELTFNFEKAYQCGNEEANVGNIVIRAAGYEVIAEGVFTYRVNDEGKIAALRAYWELDKATASARKL